MMKSVKKVYYVGEPITRAFTAGFQLQLLAALLKRGAITDSQLLRGVSLLKECTQ